MHTTVWSNNSLYAYIQSDVKLYSDRYTYIDYS